MKAGGSKRKGGKFERKLCRDLSLWVSQGQREDLFWRSAMSGGRATVQHRKGKSNQTQAGDISAIDPAGHVLTDRFVIEAKHLKDLCITSGLIEHQGDLYRIWQVVVKLAKRVNKEPLLIARQNRYSIIVLMTRGGEEWLLPPANAQLGTLHWNPVAVVVDYKKMLKRLFAM